jgi:hypothetical protein
VPQKVRLPADVHQTEECRGAQRPPACSSAAQLLCAKHHHHIIIIIIIINNIIIITSSSLNNDWKDRQYGVSSKQTALPIYMCTRCPDKIHIILYFWYRLEHH